MGGDKPYHWLTHSTARLGLQRSSNRLGRSNARRDVQEMQRVFGLSLHSSPPMLQGTWTGSFSSSQVNVTQRRNAISHMHGVVDAICTALGSNLGLHYRACNAQVATTFLCAHLRQLCSTHSIIAFPNTASHCPLAFWHHMHMPHHCRHHSELSPAIAAHSLWRKPFGSAVSRKK